MPDNLFTSEKFVDDGDGSRDGTDANEYNEKWRKGIVEGRKGDDIIAEDPLP